MRWQYRISKSEWIHLKQTQNGRPTLAGLRRNREDQRPRELASGPQAGCVSCRHIAVKLGLEK